MEATEPVLTVTQLVVGDRVSVKYPGWLRPSVGVVFHTAKGRTTAKTDDGRIFRIKCGSTITLLAKGPMLANSASARQARGEQI